MSPLDRQKTAAASTSFLDKLTTVGIGRHRIGNFSLSAQQLTPRLEYVFDESMFKTQYSDSPSADPQQHEIPQRQQGNSNDIPVCGDERFLELMAASHALVKTCKDFRRPVLGIQFLFDSKSCALRNLSCSPDNSTNESWNCTPVRRNEQFLKLMAAARRFLDDTPVKTFKDFRHRALGIEFHFKIDTNALQELVCGFDIPTVIINKLARSRSSVNDEGIIFSPAHCGRESRHACRLSHSEVVLDHSSRLLRMSGYSYTFPFRNFLHLFKLLTICFFNSVLQINDNNIPEYPQIHSARQSHKFVTHHKTSRFSSRFSLSSRRAGFWFRFYFPFFECFCLLFVLSFKIHYFDTFPFSRLADI